MKKILVPTDFSKIAHAAAKVAVDIAKKTGAEIQLLHMLELPVDMVDPLGYTSTAGPSALLVLEQTKERFNKLMKDSMFKGLTVSQNLQFTVTFQGILDEAQNEGVDLIVMGSKGASGLSEMLIGSNTEKVVRKSEIPVLVIKEDLEVFNPKKVVFASDCLKENQKGFKALLDFNAVFNSEIHLVKVNTINNFETTQASERIMEEFCKPFKSFYIHKHIYNDESIEKGILNFSRDHNCDMIALTTHGRSGLSHLFNGSIGEDLANHALRPVITFKL